jgi:hypothetical protein
MPRKTLQKEELCSLMDELVQGLEFVMKLMGAKRMPFGAALSKSPIKLTMGLLVSLGVTGRLHSDC